MGISIENPEGSGSEKTLSLEGLSGLIKQQRLLMLAMAAVLVILILSLVNLAASNHKYQKDYQAIQKSLAAIGENVKSVKDASKDDVSSVQAAANQKIDRAVDLVQKVARLFENYRKINEKRANEMMANLRKIQKEQTVTTEKLDVFDKDLQSLKSYYYSDKNKKKSFWGS